MANEKFNVVGTNIAEKATVIWNVADMLRGPFKPHEYGLVILPMTVVKRFNDCLLPTHDAVLKEYESKKNFAVLDGFLTKASGYQFYNTSKFTFDSLLKQTSVIILTDSLRMFRMFFQNSILIQLFAVWLKAIRYIWLSKSLIRRRVILARIK